MRPRSDVRFYFDFVSPYAWLALTRAEEFAASHGVRWLLRPVVYGALLDAAGLVGPAESASKRRYVFHDVLRCAHTLGRRLKGPPAHPFRSLEALRTLCLFQDEPEGLALAVGLADGCWQEGRDLTDIGVLKELVQRAGLSADGLAERISDLQVKARLREQTERAIEAGVFGVPSFLCEGRLYWGHDRLAHLADAIRGQGPDEAQTAAADRILARPRGADRRRFRQ